MIGVSKILVEAAGCMSTDLAGFISAESLPLGEIMRDWLSSRRVSNVCITQEETDQLIEQRKAATWARAKQQFTGKLRQIYFLNICSYHGTDIGFDDFIDQGVIDIYPIFYLTCPTQ